MFNKLKKKLFDWHYFLPAVLIVFTLICLINIRTAALWRDEAFTALTAQLPIADIIKISAADTQPPLYFLLLKISGIFLGYSEMVLRAWSVLATLLTLVLTYKLALGYFKNKELAGWALLLTAFNPVTFTYALEARAYAWLITLVLLSLTCAQKYMEQHEPKWLLALAATFLAGLYLHNIFIVPLVVIGALVFWESLSKHKYTSFKTYFKRNPYIFLLPLLVFAGYLPWFTYFIGQLNKISSQGFWFQFNPATDFFGVIIALFTTDQFDIRIFSFINVAFGLLAVSGFISVVYGWYKELKAGRQVLPVLSIVSLGSMILVYLISFKIPLMYYRYLVFILPFFILLTVLAWSKRHCMLAFIFVLMVITSVYYLVMMPYKKENYPELLADINYRQGYDAILTNDALPIHGLKYYSDLPAFIDTNPDNIASYEGKAILTDTDYKVPNKDNLERIWVPYIADSDATQINSYKAKLTAQGFNEAYTIRVSSGLYLSLFDRRVVAGQVP